MARRAGRALGGLPPVALAVLLSLVSLPVAVVVMPAFDASMPAPYNQSSWPHAAFFDPGVWTATATSVLVAAFASSALWGWVVGRHPFLGGLAAFSTAWAVGLVMLPIVPALLHQPLAIGAMCIDSCSAVITSGDPTLGIRVLTNPLFLVFSLVDGVGVVVILFAGVVLWTGLIRKAAIDRRQFSAPTQYLTF